MKKIVFTFIAAYLCLNFACTECLEKLVIIGAGPAGLTSSLFAGQARLNPLVIEGDPYQGQVTSIYHIENYPGLPEGISGQELVHRIRRQAEKFGARFDSGSVVAVDLNQYPFKIMLENGLEIDAESLVIATGASPQWLGIEGEAELIGLGVSASATLDGSKFVDKYVVVNGGGDSAMEQALHLAEHSSHVTIVYKGAALYGASYLQERIFNNGKIDCRFYSEILVIEGKDKGYVTGIVLSDVKTKQETALACDGVFVSNGRKPNTDMFKGQLEMTDKGYIVTKANSTLTSIPGVFVAGDISHAAYRKVATAVASGCMSAVDAAKFLSEKGN